MDDWLAEQHIVCLTFTRRSLCLVTRHGCDEHVMMHPIRALFCTFAYLPILKWLIMLICYRKVCQHITLHRLLFIPLVAPPEHQEEAS